MPKERKRRTPCRRGCRAGSHQPKRDSQSRHSSSAAILGERDASSAHRAGRLPARHPLRQGVPALLSFGIGVHHAGLLPKYRCSSSSCRRRGSCASSPDRHLGVGVNIPIRTVLFTRLAKFDGKKTTILSVRDFKQIAGRAGRKGFDTRGASSPRRRSTSSRSEERTERRQEEGHRAGQGEVSWSEETFEKLRTRPPETLKSRFRVTHGWSSPSSSATPAGRPDTQELRFAPRADPPLARGRGTKKRLLTSPPCWCARSTAPASWRCRATPGATISGWWWRRAPVGLLPPPGALALPDRDLGPARHAGRDLHARPLDPGRIDPRRPGGVLRRRSTSSSRARRPAQGRRHAVRGADGAPGRGHPPAAAQGLPLWQLNRFKGDHPWVGSKEIRPKSIGREMFEGFMASPTT